MDRPQSNVIEQAENCSLLQKERMAELLKAGGTRTLAPRSGQTVAARE